MEKKPYSKPELKEVKIKMEDTLLTGCRQNNSARINSRTPGRGCRSCRSTFTTS